MTSSLRLLVALLLALLFALPGVSGGGDGGGGGGVWVLPRGGWLPLPSPVSSVRDSRTVSMAQGITVELSPEVGVATATFVDSISQVPTGLVVAGRQVQIPATLLQALAPFAGATATVVIADASQLGYVIQITVHANNTATLNVL